MHTHTQFANTMPESRPNSGKICIVLLVFSIQIYYYSGSVDFLQHSSLVQLIRMKYWKLGSHVSSSLFTVFNFLCSRVRLKVTSCLIFFPRDTYNKINFLSWNKYIGILVSCRIKCLLDNATHFIYESNKRYSFLCHLVHLSSSLPNNVRNLDRNSRRKFITNVKEFFLF